jgi:hypothetical protein
MSRPRFLADNDLNDAIVLGVLRREPAIEFKRPRDLGLETFCRDNVMRQRAVASDWPTRPEQPNSTGSEYKLRRTNNLATAPLHALVRRALLPRDQFGPVMIEDSQQLLVLNVPERAPGLILP